MRFIILANLSLFLATIGYSQVDRPTDPVNPANPGENKKTEFCQNDLSEQASQFNDIGEGTSQAPHELWNEKQFYSIAKNPIAWSKQFIQCKDLNFQNFYSAQRPYFTLAGQGNEGQEFTGVYNGNGKKIIGFTFDVGAEFYSVEFYSDPVDGNPELLRNSNNQIGIFAVIGSSAVVQDLYIVNPKIKVQGSIESFVENIGVLAGVNKGTISNIDFTSQSNLLPTTVNTSFSRRVGLIAGFSKGGQFYDIKINKGRVMATELVGGIFGDGNEKTDVRRINGKLHVRLNLNDLGDEPNKFVPHSFGLGMGRVSGDFVGDQISLAGSIQGYIQTGGIIGTMLDRSRLQRSRFKGRVRGHDDTGGAVGDMSGEAWLNRVYVISKMETFIQGDKMGGLVGRVQGSLENRVKVHNSYAHTLMQDPAQYAFRQRVGGLIGSAFFADVLNSYAYGTLTSKYGEAIGGLIGRSQQSNIKNSYAAVAVYVDQPNDTSLIGSLFGYYFAGMATGYSQVYYVNSNPCDSCGSEHGEAVDTESSLYAQDHPVYTGWPIFWQFSEEFFPQLTI